MTIEEIKAIQRRLQSKGLYDGDIDGVMGPATRRALEIERSTQDPAAEVEKQRILLELERLQLEQAKQKQEAEREKKSQEEKAEKQRQEEENKKRREEAYDPVWNTYLPFAGGAIAGGIYGELTNAGLNRFERGNIKALNEIARELGPSNKWSNSKLSIARAKGAAQAAGRFAPSSPWRQALGAAGRFTSYALPAGAAYNEYLNYQRLADDPNAPEKDRVANQTAANILLGGATGVAAEGGRRFFFPSRGDGLGRALARIRAAEEYAKALEQPSSPRPSASGKKPKPKKIAPKRPKVVKTVEEARAELRKRGINPRGMTRGQMINSANRLLAGKSLSIGLPLAVGAYAADAARSDAEARGLTGAEQAANAAIAGGVAGGGAYAAGRGVNALANIAARAAPVVGRAIPVVGGALTVYEGVNLLRELANDPERAGPIQHGPMAAEPFMSGDVASLVADETDYMTRQRRAAEAGYMTPQRPAGGNLLARARFEPEFRSALDEFETLMMGLGQAGEGSTMAGF